MNRRLLNIIFDDEEIEEYVRHINRPRRLPQIRERPNHFTLWDDHDFFFAISPFKISSPMCNR